MWTRAGDVITLIFLLLHTCETGSPIQRYNTYVPNETLSFYHFLEERCHTRSSKRNDGSTVDVIGVPKLLELRKTASTMVLFAANHSQSRRNVPSPIGSHNV